jgi:hypothetical protein
MFHNNHNNKLMGGFFIPSLLSKEAPKEFVDYIDQSLDYYFFACVER